MIDLTEEFFTEIYPKYREIARSINDDKVLNKDITGNCAVLSVRGKSNVRSLSKLISSNGFKPTVLEFEDVLRSKGRVQKKLKNKCWLAGFSAGWLAGWLASQTTVLSM